MILEIKQDERRAKRLIEGVECRHGGVRIRRHLGAWQFDDSRLDGLIQWRVGKAGGVALLLEEVAVERGEEPGFGFGLVAQRIGFLGKPLIGALRKVRGVRLAAAEAEREPE
jgi:hypothetical protein